MFRGIDEKQWNINWDNKKNYEIIIFIITFLIFV